MAYTSQALVKAYLGIPSSTSSENTAIDNAIAAADAEIDQITGRTFVVPSGATAKTFIPYDDYTLYVDDVAQLKLMIGADPVLEITEISPRPTRTYGRELGFPRGIQVWDGGFQDRNCRPIHE